MIEQTLFLIGRILYGGILAFMGINHFTEVEQMAGYAEFKGVPAPKLAVLGSGALLVIGGLSLVLGIFPLVGIIALSIFFVGVTPVMHNFWTQEGEDQQSEMIQFLKNFALLGAALMLLITLPDWPLAIL